jgi:hypothetical protein
LIQSGLFQPASASRKTLSRKGRNFLFEDLMFKDVLKPVLTDFPLQEPTLHVVYVSRKHLPLKIRAFIDFAQETASRIQPRRLAAAR